MNKTLSISNKNDEKSILYIEDNEFSTFSLYSLPALTKHYNIKLKIIKNSSQLSSDLLKLAKSGEKFSLSITHNGENINNLMRSLSSNGTVCLLSKESYNNNEAKIKKNSIVLGVSRLIFNGMKFHGLSGGVSSLLNEIKLEEEKENLLQLKNFDLNSSPSTTTSNGSCGGCEGGCPCTKPVSSFEGAIREVLPLISSYKVEVKGFPLENFEEASTYVSEGKQAILLL